VGELPTITSRPLIYVHKIPISKTRKFWDGIKEGRLFATKCRVCGKIYYPPQADCSQCLSSDMEWVEVPGEGVIETFAASYLKPQGFEDYPEPYIIAIASVEELGIRVMGLIRGVRPEDVHVGMRVRIRPCIGSDGYHVIFLEPTE